MSRTGFLVSACALALVFGTTGCDDTRDGDDSGTIMLMDSGPPMTDTGPPVTDTGPPAATCTVTGIMPLPMTCLPRCAMATITAANMCTTPACQQAAFEADTTAGVAFMVGTQTSTLDCAGCNLWQQQTCFADSCPTEFQAFVTCQGGGGDCSAEQTAVNSCVTTNMAAVQNCVNTRGSACFSQTAGFLPGAWTGLNAILN